MRLKISIRLGENSNRQRHECKKVTNNVIISAFLWKFVANDFAYGITDKSDVMENFALEHLIGLPLFQGVGRSELAQFSSYIPHKIVKYADGEVIAADETSCNRLAVVFHGVVEVKGTAANSRFAVREKLCAPVAIQPEALYGISPRFTYTYTAAGEVRTLEIPKAGVTMLFSRFEVFRLNLVNLLATIVCRQRRWLWRDQTGTLEKRIADFILAHCIYPAGEKRIEITKENLGNQVNDTRFNVTCALKRMKEAGVLELRRGRILIPKAERLIQLA